MYRRKRITGSFEPSWSSWRRFRIRTRSASTSCWVDFRRWRPYGGQTSTPLRHCGNRSTPTVKTTTASGWTGTERRNALSTLNDRWRHLNTGYVVGRLCAYSYLPGIRGYLRVLKLPVNIKIYAFFFLAFTTNIAIRNRPNLVQLLLRNLLSVFWQK